ncbi:MAG: hypothetical protein IJR46_08160, partial [Neisseriaceae bacterium]|nr:hypothetical protein [Neisseriaceae bacterium]
MDKSLSLHIPFPNSQRKYLSGYLNDDLRVPYREISQSDTITDNGVEQNPPIPVYDSSGVYGDDNAVIDLQKGSPDIRSMWIEQRGDTQVLSELSSDYGKKRLNNQSLDDIRFPNTRKPRKAKSGQCVTQMYYAKQGIITPEMEFVAIRERMNLDKLFRLPEYQNLIKQHAGQNFGANMPKTPD